MAGYETLEVLLERKLEQGRLPVEVAVEKQCRIRDDDSKTRPFIKMKLAIGNRIIFCDPKQAEDLASLIRSCVAQAQEAISQLLEEQEDRRKMIAESPKRRRDSGRTRRDRECPRGNR